MKRLANYFFQGLIYLAPIALTIWIFVTVFLAIDGILRLPVPGVGFVLLIAFVTFFGWLLSKYLANRLFTMFENLMDRLPFAKLMHGSLKDLMSAFVGEKRRFRHPVAVELIPGSGVRVLGFVTRDDLGELGITDAVAVYLPQAYNFAGQLIIVPRERVQPLAADSADVMTTIVSGGVATGHSRIDMKAPA
jgi:uncharacterized membrane protein